MLGLKSMLEFPLFLRQRRLAAERAQMTKDEFVSRTASTASGKLVATILWDKLSALKSYSDFTPYPSDNLLRVFGLAEEDLDVDVVIDILKRLHCKTPDQTIVDAIGAVNTPADVVRFIEKSCLRST